MYSMCFTCVTLEIVTWSDICYYCCVLDYEILTFSWEGIETLTSWENKILLSACGIWTLTSFSWNCGREMLLGDMEWECWHGFQEHSERNVKRTKSKHTSVYDRITVGSIPRICSSFFAHHFEAKVGRGCLLKYSIRVYALPSFLAIFNTCEVDHQDDCYGFLEEWQLWWTCTTGNQWHLCSY